MNDHVLYHLPTTPLDILDFWFSETSGPKWFAKEPSFDAVVSARYGAVLQDAKRGELFQWRETIRGRLAEIIVLDQFSRNLFRDSPRAYSADSIARRLARTAIEQGFDIAMTRQERLFIYLPFEHSEDRADQAYSINLVKQLGREDWTHSAVKHKAIIDQFGRFPHRNAVLNRLSTAGEIAFLKEPKNSF